MVQGNGRLLGTDFGHIPLRGDSGADPELSVEMSSQSRQGMSQDPLEELESVSGVRDAWVFLLDLMSRQHDCR